MILINQKKTIIPILHTRKQELRELKPFALNHTKNCAVNQSVSVLRMIVLILLLKSNGEFVNNMAR